MGGGVCGCRAAIATVGVILGGRVCVCVCVGGGHFHRDLCKTTLGENKKTYDVETVMNAFAWKLSSQIENTELVNLKNLTDLLHC
jgi:hypothetical protein